jgi:hypothetical protein
MPVTVAVLEKYLEQAKPTHRWKQHLLSRMWVSALTQHKPSGHRARQADRGIKKEIV